MTTDSATVELLTNTGNVGSSVHDSRDPQHGMPEERGAVHKDDERNVSLHG